MLEPSPTLSCDAQATSEENMDAVVVRGRDPRLLLRDVATDKAEDKSVQQWGGELFDKMADIARLLDQANDSQLYREVLAAEAAKISDASLTPSAQVLAAVVSENQSLTKIALARAIDYRQQLLANDYQEFSADYFTESVADSLQKQSAIEQSDNVDFDTFLQDYFS